MTGLVCQHNSQPLCQVPTVPNLLMGKTYVYVHHVSTKLHGQKGHRTTGFLTNVFNCAYKIRIATFGIPFNSFGRFLRVGRISSHRSYRIIAAATAIAGLFGFEYFSANTVKRKLPFLSYIHYIVLYLMGKHLNYILSYVQKFFFYDYNSLTQFSRFSFSTFGVWAIRLKDLKN